MARTFWWCAWVLSVPLIMAVAIAQAPKPAPAPAPRAEIAPLSSTDAAAAEHDYQRYCSLCHGKDRKGHANDEAPSLRSRTLFESGFTWPMFDQVAYGRPGTAMGGYLDDVGGPLSRQDIRRMTTWLRDEIVRETGQPIVRIEAKSVRVQGDIALGQSIYQAQCSSCHGAKGEGGLGTALGNPAMLKLTPDWFLRYAIEHGRDGSPMPAFKDTLKPQEIDAVTAFLRSKDAGWSASKKTLDAPPPKGQYILNPNGKPPVFALQDDMYVKAAELDRVLKTKPRIVLLDTRVASMWQQGHIAGAVPIPYYSSTDDVIRDLPRDGTWIVAYCECPRAAAESVVKRLREQGFKNTAVLWEGIGGWVTQGYPTVQGTLANGTP